MILKQQNHHVSYFLASIVIIVSVAAGCIVIMLAVSVALLWIIKTSQQRIKRERLKTNKKQQVRQQPTTNKSVVWRVIACQGSARRKIGAVGDEDYEGVYL